MMRAMAGTLEDPFATLLAAARQFAGVEEGIACAGTKLESRTLKVGGKAFAFFKPGSLMCKLGESLPEARALAAKAPAQWCAGNGGWVEVKAQGGRLPLPQLRRWLAESHALFATPAGKAPAAKAAKQASATKAQSRVPATKTARQASATKAGRQAPAKRPAPRTAAAAGDGRRRRS